MNIASLRGRIDVDITPALRAMKQAENAMKTLAQTKAVLNVQVDISRARQQLRPLVQSLQSFQSKAWSTDVNLNVKTNLANAEAALRQFKKDANALKTLIKPIDLRVNTKGTQKQLQPLISQLRTFQKASANLNIKATVTEAMAKLRQVLEILKEIMTVAKTPIKINISGESVKVLRDIQKQLTMLTGSGTNWSNVARQSARSTAQLGQSAGQANGTLSRLKETLFAFVSGYLGIQLVQRAMAALKYVFIDFNNVLDQSRVGFTTLFANTGISIGDAEKRAQSLLETLKQFSIPTPFALADLAPLTQQMMAFGLVAKNSLTVGRDLTTILRQIGDAAYGLGRGKEGVDRIVLALGQMKVATRVMGQEMLQLQQMGVNAWQYLAEATGKSTAEVRALVEKGLVPADGAIKAILAGLERDFGGGMERAAKTLGGAWSNVLDAINVKLSNFFKSQHSDLTQFVIDIANVLDSAAFDRWATATIGKISTVVSFITGAFTGLVEEIQNANPVLVGLLTALGARFVWLGVLAVQQMAIAARAAIASIVAFSSTTTGQLIIVTAAVAAFAAAYSNNMYGVRDVTNKVVSFINRQLAGLSKGFAYYIEKLSGVLQSVPDVVFQVMPGGTGQAGLMLKQFLGDQTGLKDQVTTYWDEILAGIKSPAGLGVDTGIKLNIFGDFQKMLADARAEADKASKDIAKSVGKIPAIDLSGGDKAKAAKAAEKAALKLLKDQLGDSAQAWDTYATAVEKAADRQIKALRGIQDSLVNLFDGLKQNLVQAGIVTDPLQPIINRLAGVLNLRGNAVAIAAGAQSRIDFARSQGNAARSQLERVNGQDGFVPSKYNPGATVLNQIADAVNTPMGAAACARFVSFAFDKMGIAIKKSDAAGQLVKNAIAAGAKEIPVSQAGAGDLVYQYGRKYGVLKDGQGNGYHVGIGIGNGQVAAKNRNYVGPMWRNARALDTSVLAGGGAQAQTAVNSSFTPGGSVGGTSLLGSLQGFAPGLSNVRAVPREWLELGGAVRDSATTKARFGIQSMLTTEQGGAFWDALVAKIGNATKAAKFLRVEIANALDARLNAASLPQRIEEAGRATAEFAQAKRRELTVLRDASKWLQANTFDTLEFAKAQEATKARLEAENDERLKGLPLKQREWNITTRVKAAVGALVETYRHNAFAQHVQRLAELDKEYAALGATTLEAQIAQKIYNQENARSLTDAEKQLQITKELRNERAKYAQETLRAAQSAATEARRAIEDLDVKNPIDALFRQHERADEDRRLIDPNWIPSLDIIKARGEQVAAALQKWRIEGFRGTLETVREMMADTELSIQKIGQWLNDVRGKVASGETPKTALPGTDLLDLLNDKAGRNDAGKWLDDLKNSIGEFSTKAAQDLQEFSNRSVDAVQSAQDAANAFRAELQALLILMQSRGINVEQYAGILAVLNAQLESAVSNTAKLNAQTKAADYNKILGGVWQDMGRASYLTGIFDPFKREIAEFRFWLQDQGISEVDIAKIIPAKEIQMRAQEAAGYMQQFLGGLQSTFTSAFESLYTDGPGAFFDNLLKGLEQTLAQMAAQILASMVTQWLTGLLGGALGGGSVGSSMGGGGLPGFSTGLDRVPYDDYVVRTHKDEAILTAQEAQEWRAQKREAAKMPTRSSGGGGGGNQGGGVTIVQQFHVGQVVANNPDEFRKKLPGRGVSQHEMNREVALRTAKGLRGGI